MKKILFSRNIQSDKNINKVEKSLAKSVELFSKVDLEIIWLQGYIKVDNLRINEDYLSHNQSNFPF